MTTNPSCSGLPSVSLSVGITTKSFEFISNTKCESFFQNGELYFTNNADLTIKNYILNTTNTFTKNKTTKKNNFYGFKSNISPYIVNLPSFTIPKFPRIDSSCQPCESKFWPRSCDYEKKKKLGIPYKVATKCEDQLLTGDKTFPESTLFQTPQTDLEFSFQFAPTVEMNSNLVLASTVGASATIGTDPEVTAGITQFSSLQITKLKIGLKMKIKKLEFFVGTGSNRKGFSIGNVIIPVIPAFDFLNGGKLLNIYADSAGNLSVFYLIKAYTWNLYDILNVNIDAIDNSIPSETASINGTTPIIGTNLLQKIISGAGEVVKNLLKSTNIYINMGLLVCPLPNPNEDVFLSFVTSASIENRPFQGLNKLTIPDIPKIDIPKIPNVKIPGTNISFLSDSQVDHINSVNRTVTEPATNKASELIVVITKHVKNVLENITIAGAVEVPIPLIFKNIPILPGV